MVAGADRDQPVGRRHRDSACPRPAREIHRHLPDLAGDGQLRQYALKLSKLRLLTVAAGAVPEFEADHRAPTRCTATENALDAFARGGVPVGAQQVDSRQRVDQNQWLSLASLPPQLLDRRQVRTGLGMSGQRRHASATVELHDGGNDRLALRARAREAHRVGQLAIRNINGRFHDSCVCRFGKRVNLTAPVFLPSSCGNDWLGTGPDHSQQSRRRGRRRGEGDDVVRQRIPSVPRAP